MNIKHVKKISSSVAYLGVMFIIALAPIVFSDATHFLSLSAAHAQEAAASTAPSTDPSLVGWIGDKVSAASLFVGRWTFALLAGIVIALGTKLLAVASGLFSILVTYTIIAFGDTNGLLNPSVINAINTAWTAFRDISNIIIIAFFTFIAINIILGTSEFGQKKLIARVLIVATLINFSLLFTKIIIDFSNYTATQFYNASIKRNLDASGACPGSPGCPGNSTALDGIGDRLVNYMGISSVGGAIEQIAAKGEKGGKEDITAMVVYALFSIAILFGAAMVLFYGSFILASRAILLIFLMITASLAFASHLLPDSYANGKPGWDMWWRSLIESAVLAPILMLFLWATLAMAKALQTPTSTLGDLANHPTNTANLGSLVSYFIILGLLFATFRVASGFSTSISGFNWASVVPAMSIASGARITRSLARGTSRLAGAGLNTAGNRLQASGSRFATMGGKSLSGIGNRLGVFGTSSSRGGGGLAGAVVANQVQNTGLNRANLFPARAATKAIADAANKIKQSPAGPPHGQLPPPKPGDTDATHAAIADSSGDLTKIKQEEQARIEATKQITDSNKNLAEEIKGAVAAGGSSGAGEVGKQVAGALKEQGEETRASMQEIGAQTQKATEASATKIGEEFKSATTTIGGTLTKGMEGVQKITQKAVEIQTKSIEETRNDKLAQRAGAEEEHAKSIQKGDNRAIQANIEAAQIQAQTATQHFADLHITQTAPGGRYEPAAPIEPARLPGSTPPTASFAPQGNFNAPVGNGNVNIDAILQQTRNAPLGSIRDLLKSSSRSPASGTIAANGNHQQDTGPMNKAA